MEKIHENLICIEKLKREAKRLSKKEGIKLSEALKKLSQERGFEHFHEANQISKKHKINKVLCFDLETFPLSPEFLNSSTIAERLAHAPFLKLACVFDVNQNEYKFFNENEVKALITLIKSADTLISYNGNRFDILVLRKHYKLKGKIPSKGKHIDLCELVTLKAGHMVSLDALSRLNLNESKHTSGNEVNGLSTAKIKLACVSDVRQTFELWKLFEKDQLQYPPSPFGHSFRSVSNPISQSIYEDEDEDMDSYEDMTEGQMAVAMAGFH